jgi:precorrin-8X/cobalt-precorrin-8 methylmutase
VGGALSEYLKDGAAIYERSFAIIRAEADLTRFDRAMGDVAVRMIHACGMVDLVDDISATDGFVGAAQEALLNGRPILCDTEMVRSGVTRSLLPGASDVMCTLSDPAVADLAAELGTTRTAAALELWRPVLHGALVVVGNAPTALFRLLELVDAGAPTPAAVVGVPVGFVGAAESKAALADRSDEVQSLVVRGRRGGSAIAAAVVNALSLSAR